MDKINDALDYILNKIKKTPEIGIILGSGLSNIVNDISIHNIIYYSDIPNFPVSTVSGHEGRFLFGNWNGKEVVIMQGRVHFYEGYTMQEVTIPIRIMGLLGIKKLFITNAAGGITVPKGNLMIITDHIANFVPSPLVGKNNDDFGPRFPDMTNVYNKEDIEKLKGIFKKLDLDIYTGIYVQTMGPQYETPAEIKMMKMLGADAVGMSTACEAIVARHMGIEVCGISSISNMAAGIENTELNHTEVIEMGKILSDKIFNVINEYLKS